MQELEIVKILKENDLSDVEVLKNTEEYILVNFYFDFDKDLQDAAKAYANEESKEEPGTIISATKEGMKVSCGSNVLLIKKIQLPNGKPLTIEQYINGHKIEKKEKLG